MEFVGLCLFWNLQCNTLILKGGHLRCVAPSYKWGVTSVSQAGSSSCAWMCTWAERIIVQSDDREVTRRPVKRWSLIFIRSDYSTIRNSFFFLHTDINVKQFFFFFSADEKKTSKSFWGWRRELCIITSALFYSVKTPLSEPLNN